MTCFYRANRTFPVHLGMGLAAQRGDVIVQEGFFGPGDLIASLEPVQDPRLLQILEPVDQESPKKGKAKK